MAKHPHSTSISHSAFSSDPVYTESQKTVRVRSKTELELKETRPKMSIVQNETTTVSFQDGQIRAEHWLSKYAYEYIKHL